MLRTARGVFAAQGYGGATLDAIAAAIGVRKATLVHHFGSKEALYTEAVLDLFGELKQLVVSALALDADAPADFAARLDLLSDAVTAFLYRNREAAGLIILELSRPTGDRPGTGRAADTLRTLGALLGAGLESGAHPQRDPGHLFLSIMGVNLLYFAVPAVAGVVVGHDVFAPGAEERRAAQVRAHVRALCGLPALAP